MKKVKLSEEKKVVLQLVIGLLCCIACICVYFALEKPETQKQVVCYCENKNADLTENNVKEKAVVVLAGNQEFVAEQPKRISLGEFKLTAYCSCRKCCGFWANGRPVDENGSDIVIGASGERLYQGVSVAVDPAVIPYDSKVYIDGKEYIAHDCGGAIKGNRIDVYFDNHEDALRFGIQYANVEVDG
jgi:3D (Asp-Asp-Asp) domain-containing protein